MNRVLVLIGALFAALCVVLWLLLLASTEADTTRLVKYYPLLLLLNAGITLFLLALVVWQSRSLWREYYARKFGARLKFRLMWMFGIVAIIPALLVYVVSIQFVTRSIDSWFNVRVEQGLSAGIQLGQELLKKKLEDWAKEVRHSLQKTKMPGATQDVSGYLTQLQNKIKADQIVVYSPEGTRLTQLHNTPLTNNLSPAQIAVLLEYDMATNINHNQSDEILLQVLQPIILAEKEQLLIEVTKKMPDLINQNAASVNTGYMDYQTLLLNRAGLTNIYSLTLTLSVLLALFTAFALALEMSRRLTAPLFFLAEGTRAVGQGDFTPRKALKGSDELGAITQSFAQMIQQLDETRHQADRHREDLEEARAYLESILSNLSTGVLVFDKNFILKVCNLGASAILDCQNDAILQRPLDIWTQNTKLPPEFGNTIQQQFTNTSEEWNMQLDITTQTGRLQSLLLRGSRLPSHSGGGHIVVFDDISDLLSAQRSAAWGEVARRLAHEIKNPLTPIQLSAERLQYKLSGELKSEPANLLKRSTQTIIKQVQNMKTMVNNFRDYSSLPAAQLEDVDLNRIVSEVLVLYENSPTRVENSLAENLPRISGDESQLRQVIHNLLKNSCDALELSQACQSDKASVLITTEYAENSVQLIVEDNGPGFTPENFIHAFEPYISNKKQGSGLGLAIVKKIVEEHYGKIEISNQANNNGAKVRIILPPLTQASKH